MSTQKNKPKSDRFQERARQLISLYFNPSTPAFVRDVLSSWLTRLETETQVFWNKRPVLEIALPLMLREAHVQGIDVDNPKSELCLDALHESIGVHAPRETTDDEPEARGDVEARSIFDLIQNPHTSEGLKDSISDLLDTAHPWHTWEVFRVAWPIALAKLSEQDEVPAVTATRAALARASQSEETADEEEARTRAVFDFLHDKRRKEPQATELLNKALELLENASPLFTWEAFRVVWPLAIASASEKDRRRADEITRAALRYAPGKISPMLETIMRTVNTLAPEENAPDETEKVKQYTPVLMQPITNEAYAVELVGAVIVGNSADALIELVAGIAAIESPLIRQELAYQVIRDAFMLTSESSATVANHVAGIYTRGKEGQQ